jgi:hypothetical protein
MSTTNFLSTKTRLKSMNDWPDWLSELTHNAKRLYIWDAIDPDGPTVVNKNRDLAENVVREGPTLDDPLVPLAPPTEAELLGKLGAEREEEYARLLKEYETAHPAPDASSASSAVSSGTRQQGQRTTTPAPRPFPPKAPTWEDIERRLGYELKVHASKTIAWETRRNAYLTVTKWVDETVDTILLQHAKKQAGADGEFTTQALIRVLRLRLAPVAATTYATVEQRYRDTISLAERGGVTVEKWFADWEAAYLKALECGIADVTKPTAVAELLRALQKKLFTDWAQGASTKHLQDQAMGRPGFTFEEFRRIMPHLINENNQRRLERAPGLFATLPPREESSTGTNPRSNNTPNTCPCTAATCVKKSKHLWKPANCDRLRAAVLDEPMRPRGGTGGTYPNLSDKDSQLIRTSYDSPTFAKLREALVALDSGWPRSA